MYGTDFSATLRTRSELSIVFEKGGRREEYVGSRHETVVVAYDPR